MGYLPTVLSGAEAGLYDGSLPLWRHDGLAVPWRTSVRYSARGRPCRQVERKYLARLDSARDVIGLVDRGEDGAAVFGDGVEGVADDVCLQASSAGNLREAALGAPLGGEDHRIDLREQ